MHYGTRVKRSLRKRLPLVPMGMESRTVNTEDVFSIILDPAVEV